MKEFLFPTEIAYLEAWRHCRSMDYEFFYNRYQRSIKIDVEQDEFAQWSVYRLTTLAEGR